MQPATRVQINRNHINYKLFTRLNEIREDAIRGSVVTSSYEIWDMAQQRKMELRGEAEILLCRLALDIRTGIKAEVLVLRINHIMSEIEQQTL